MQRWADVGLRFLKNKQAKKKKRLQFYGRVYLNEMKYLQKQNHAQNPDLMKYHGNVYKTIALLSTRSQEGARLVRQR